ncbi:MAG: MFS transporter [Nocardioidaceae bacterium]|nr:MFS transporter [Nocardioidaceae bacterium]NUS52736.1 MFS transporter [Nocardioidaceae bacterium]
MAARNAVLGTFFLNGFAFATWASRIPSVRHALDLGPGSLGLLLLACSIGSLLALPTSGGTVQRYGARRVVVAATLVEAVGLILVGVGVGVLELVPVTALGLFLVGLGTGTWDVAMNVEGAEVERLLRRSIMPRFHAAFSLGTVAGAGVGALVTFAGVGVLWHVGAVGVLVAVLGGLSVRGFLEVDPDRRASAKGNALKAWAEPRTVLIGVMVLALALTEGVANDWLGVAMVDGYGAPAWLGAATFALFVAAMTTGRVVGTVVLDAYGRQTVLWGTMALAAVGVLLVVLGQVPGVVALGVVLWGLGASLGFPVGMSAAADDPAHAAARVSVVSTIGYTAFLGGPPLLGFIGSQVGVLNALLVVSIVLVPSALVVPATRRPDGS